MNPDLARLQTYPFQKLNALYEGVEPHPGKRSIALHIGEPRHATPAFIRQTLIEHLDGLATYPPTRGGAELRAAMAAWLERRHGLERVDPDSEILPVNGSREALFAFAQAVVDATRASPVVICPNPFYQIYEGAALLARATPHYLNTVPEQGYAFDFGEVSAELWQRTQLVYVCSPANPTGHVMSIDEWRGLFALADRHGFVIASDECYSEIYFDEANPPLGALRAARELGRSGHARLIVFSSLSKRSNVPGMRSGFVAGDAEIMKAFLLYRTYHGCAMSPPVHAASIAAWEDEAHVVENRSLYRAKFDAVLEVLHPVLEVARPDASFYLWPRTPLPDTEFARRLYREQSVSVLPGSFLGRTAHGINPRAGRVRIALVAPLEECVEAAVRIREFVAGL